MLRKNVCRNLLAAGLLVFLNFGVIVAQVTIIPVGTPVPTNGDCITLSNSYDFTLSDLTNKSNFQWYVYGGDLQIISGATSSTVTVRSANRSGVYPDGYGKARLRVSYIDANISADCGPQYRDFDLYKLFAPPAYAIIGPKCVSAEKPDTVTYSIRQIVSVNINDQIGIDRYRWSLPNNWENNILYYSGDSSSITFVVSQPLPEPQVITVEVGKCNFNSWHYELEIGQVTEKPTYAVKPPSCLPTSTTTTHIAVNQVSGVNYKWTILNNASWNFINGTNANSQDFIDLNIGTTSGAVVLAATGTCNTAYDTVYINRSLGNDITINGSNCVAADGVYPYTLTPAPNTQISWKVPAGWVVDPNNLHAQQVNIVVAPNATSGYIKASALNCPGDTVSFPVNIKPNKPVINNADHCATRNVAQNYSITAVPNATSYTWTFPTGWSPQTYTSPNGITVTASSTPGTNASGGNILVHANGCQASADAIFAVDFPPTAPGAITRNPATCINLNKVDTVTFTVTNVPGTLYDWVIPAGWSALNPSTSNQITMLTDGVAGNHTVQVRSYTTTTCGFSEYSSLVVPISGIGSNVTVTKTDLIDGGVKIGETLSATFVSGTTYTWYRNDQLFADGRIIDLSVQDQQATYCVDARKTGCVNRACTTSIYTAAAAPVNGSSGVITEGVKVYPNPATSAIDVELSSELSGATLKLLDSTGSTVYTAPATGKATRIKTSDLKKGVYYLKVIGKNKTVERTLLIQDK